MQMTSDSILPPYNPTDPDLENVPAAWRGVARIVFDNELAGSEPPATVPNTSGGEDLDALNEMRRELGDYRGPGAYYEKIMRKSRGQEPVERKPTQANPEQFGLTLEGDEEFKACFAEAVRIGLQGRQPGVILYPGCGNHVSPAAVFEDARIIFVDENPEVTHEFVQYNANNPKKLEFYRSDMHEFAMPGGVRADVVFLYNTDNMTESELDGVLAPNGVVLENLNLDDELYMHTCPGYEFVGTIPYIERDGVEDATNSLHVFRRKESSVIADN